MTRFTIDRFEGELAVLLKKGDETVEKIVPVGQLPSEVKEGDLLEETDASNFCILHSETEERRRNAQVKLNRLKKRPNSR